MVNSESTAETQPKTPHTPAAVLDSALRVIHKNEAFTKVFGSHCLIFHVPAVRQRLEERFVHGAADSNTFEVEAELPGLGARTLECSARRIAADPWLLLLSVADVTERRKTALWLHGRAQILDHLEADAPLELVLASLVQLLEELHSGMLSSVLLLDESGERLFEGASGRLPEDYVEAINGVQIGPEVGSCGTAAFTRRRVVVEDIETDPLWRDYRDLARAHRLRACWSEPIVSRTGKILGTLAMYYRSPRTPTAEELRSIEAAAELAAEAIRCKQLTRDLAERADASSADAERATEALERSESRYRTLIGQLPVIVYSSEPGGRVLSLSIGRADYERIFGYAPHEFESDPSLLARLVHPDDRARVHTAKSELQADHLDIEYRLVARDGSVRWFRDIARIGPDTTGERSVIQGVMLDTTDQRRFEMELVQSQRLKAVGDLSSGVAHEYNNLLMGIAGCARISLDKLERGDTTIARSMLDDILNSAERGASLARDLLSFSCASDGTAPTDLDKVVGAAERMLGSLLPDTIQLQVRCGAPAAFVSLPAGQIMQVLTNLVINGRDAMPDGGTIEVTTKELLPGPGGEAQIGLTVRDTGGGIPAEVRERIFEPFFTTKRASGGSGIGLAVVYGILRQHGADITVESEPSVGTTFRIVFPRSALTQAAAPKREHVVLVVDDDAMVRRTLRFFLENAGFPVFAASDAESCLEACRAQDLTPDVLVVDVELPRMGGKELVEQLRRRWPQVPAIFVSAYPRATLLATQRIDPTAPLLEKPFTQETLIEVIDEQIRNSTAIAQPAGCDPHRLAAATKDKAI